eukprot:CAMPEP_0176383716 /NCGR_PEP_ID=MMETSP0126-20121128/33733_1 /TAXON_ID=141414 ORGANISM="Strombidinopsis acuminatum, Strain SPMC142" /NCGR_SAMPLE_ID=MMETSP0126 /ASSEMBLY_ACC=CAM_ASM_000229 /LENGTH=82 /DNA_ID=CAMNT_0017748965 /DNA_START=3141 /DNA_END=3389 /DNA_ORIENTATION=+
MTHYVTEFDSIMAKLYEQFPEREFMFTQIQAGMIYADEFLVEKHILANAYREHGELNFEAKIFFFEPINKFYDLPLIKNIAW